MASEQSSVTALLGRWKGGDRTVEAELAGLIYPVLRSIAGAQVRSSSSALTLKPTELAHEAYIRLFDQAGGDWRDRAHFFGFAAGVLRHVIIDYLRERSAQKRGGGQLFVEIGDLSAHDEPQVPDQVDWLSVDQAIGELQQLDPECARVVELRIFSGMSTEEIAEACGTSVATVGRRWRFARSWLAERLESFQDASGT